MARPCLPFHEFSPTKCGICKLVATQERYRIKWGERDHQPIGKDGVKKTSLPVIPCPHRSDEPISYCGSCGNSKNSGRYDCDKFDETVVLYHRRGMRDCQSCKENPNLVQSQVEEQ
jgi:hypothetical protein